MFFSVTSRSMFSGDPSFVIAANRTASLAVVEEEEAEAEADAGLLLADAAGTTPPRAASDDKEEAVAPSVEGFDDPCGSALGAKRASMNASLEDVSAEEKVEEVEAESEDDDDDDEEEEEDDAPPSGAPPLSFWRFAGTEGSASIALRARVESAQTEKRIIMARIFEEYLEILGGFERAALFFLESSLSLLTASATKRSITKNYSFEAAVIRGKAPSKA
jgi:hypothetical protein